jgi:hypothetical protein
VGGRHLFTAIPVLLACAATASAALLAGEEPGIPDGYRLLEQKTVPATTPFNGGVRLKTIFRGGQTYYMVASGTASLGDGHVTLDPVYCIDASPPIGACPPAVPPTYWGGLNLIWYSGRTYASYNTTLAYGDAGQGWIKYQPSHRYVFRFKAPANFTSARLSLGGPNSSSPSSASGTYSISVYGTPPPTYFDLRGYPCGKTPSDTEIVLKQSGCIRVVVTTEAAPSGIAANEYSFRIQHLVRSLATGKLEWDGVTTDQCGRGESDVTDEPVWRCAVDVRLDNVNPGETEHFRAFMYQGNFEKPSFMVASGPLTITMTQ